MRIATMTSLQNWSDVEHATAMSGGNIPADGDVVVFARVPAASYARPGEEYLVRHEIHTRRGRRVVTDVQLVNVASGAATFDRPWAWRTAVWRRA